MPTASRSFGIDIFATAGRGNNDYGLSLPAYSFGADVALFGQPKFGLQTAIEVRETILPSDNIGQKNLAAGIRLGKTFHRYTPYADVMVGYGIITFPGSHDPNYTSDNSITYNYGAGVDIRLFGAFSAKADFQQQSWKIGDANSRLTPTNFTGGIVYTLPFNYHIFR